MNPAFISIGLFVFLILFAFWLTLPSPLFRIRTKDLMGELGEWQRPGRMVRKKTKPKNK